MIIAGGWPRAKCATRFMPIRGGRIALLTNWALMALGGRGRRRTPHRADWNRPARRDQVLAFVSDNFR